MEITQIDDQKNRGRHETPWTHTVRGLVHSSASRAATPERAQHGASQWQDNAFGQCTVKVEERLTEAAFALSWSDSTRCHYREQIWKRATARRSGICVLSGEAIRRGDAVFRPLATRFKIPLNSRAMILAVSLETRADCPIEAWS